MTKLTLFSILSPKSCHIQQRSITDLTDLTLKNWKDHINNKKVNCKELKCLHLQCLLIIGHLNTAT